MHYIYVPYKDAKMDDFAEELETTKNAANKVFGRHQLIRRGVSEEPLAAVGYLDRLYVCVHGTDKRGEGAYTKEVWDAEGMHTVTVRVNGAELASELIRKGLKNKLIDLRLWTCYGGDDPLMNFDDNQELRNFACQVHSALHGQGLKWVSVTGYTKLVDITVKELRKNGGHKKLMQDDETTALSTTNHKVCYAAKII